MKRLLTFALALMLSIAAFAQNDVTKKSWFVGGTGSIGYVNNFTFTLEPQIGYEINERLAIGTGVGLVLTSDDNYTVILGVAEPYVRFCAWHNERFFFDLKATAGFAFDEVLELCQIGIRPSLRFRLNEHWDMAADLGLLGAQYTFTDGWRPAFGIEAISAALWFAYRF